MKCPRCGLLLEVSAAAAGKSERIRCRGCGESFAPIAAPPPPPGGSRAGSESPQPFASAFSPPGPITRPAPRSSQEPAPPPLSAAESASGHKLTSLGHWARRIVKRPTPRRERSAAEEPIWLLELADGTRYGPVNRGELEEWVEENRLTGDSLLSCDAGENWYWACDVFPEHPFVYTSEEQSRQEKAAARNVTPARRWQALEWVTGPAIGLILHAMLGIVLHGVWLCFILWAAITDLGRGEWQEAWLEASRGMTPLVPIFTGCLTVFASLRLLRLDGYGWGLAAAWLSIIPCLSPCCISGVPLGGWMLVVLMQTPVKLAFQEQAEAPDVEE